MICCFFGSNSFFFKLFFLPGKENRRDQKRVSGHNFCVAIAFNALPQRGGIFLFLVTYITAEGTWASRPWKGYGISLSHISHMMSNVSRAYYSLLEKPKCSTTRQGGAELGGRVGGHLGEVSGGCAQRPGSALPCTGGCHRPASRSKPGCGPPPYMNVRHVPALGEELPDLARGSSTPRPAALIRSHHSPCTCRPRCLPSAHPLHLNTQTRWIQHLPPTGAQLA